MAQPRVLVLFAEGSEELETVAVVDLLRRAHVRFMRFFSFTDGLLEAKKLIRWAFP